jgi:hypothetical protein
VSAARIKEILSKGLARGGPFGLSASFKAAEVEEILAVAQSLERDGETYRETCKAAQARGTEKHEQVVAARNVVRSLLRAIYAMPNTDKTKELYEAINDAHAPDVLGTDGVGSQTKCVHGWPACDACVLHDTVLANSS